MKVMRDAATLLILILLVASFRVSPVETRADLVPESEVTGPLPALHLTDPASLEGKDQYCPAIEEEPALKVTRTRTSRDLPASCRS